MTRVIVGMYDELSDAQNAVEELVDNGVHRDDISLISSHPDQQNGDYLEITNGEGDQAATGAIGGAIGGGLLGGLGGLLLGLGMLVIPGIGPVIAAGPIVTTLAGAGIGAATGGFIGALVGWGIPAEEAEYYAEGIRRGGTLLMVKAADDQVEPIERIMNHHYLVDLEERVEGWRGEGWTGFDAHADAPARVDFASEAATDSLRPQVTMPATEGQPDYGTYLDYERHAHVYQSHHANTPDNRNRTYNDVETGYRYGHTLALDQRYTDHNWTDIEPEIRHRWEREYPNQNPWNEISSSVKYAWDRMTHWAGYKDFVADFHRHHETYYAAAGRPYTYYEPAYRFGHTLAMDEQYRGRRWTSIEPEARRRWEQEYPDLDNWGEFDGAVHYGWERTTQQNQAPVSLDKEYNTVS